MSPALIPKVIFLLRAFTIVNSYALPQVIQDRGNDNSEPATLIGDLRTGITSPTGQRIANILLGLEDGQSDITGSPPSSLSNPSACKTSRDPCCVYYQISHDLTQDFRGRTGRCNQMARGAIRLGFHDAGTWSQKLASQGQDFGGADGSFVLFSELVRSENKGLGPITMLAKQYQKKYGVGMGDLVQYMALHAVVTCPLGPRVRAFIGRKDANRASPPGLLPGLTDSADSLIALFQDKTITPHMLTALLGAHSTSQQFFVSPSRFGAPQDSTPAVWDVAFYNETVQSTVKQRVFRFQSDSTIAHDSRCSGEWNAFIGDQKHWNEDYAAAAIRLSLLGVNNINSLTECTATLPAARPVFAGSGEAGVTE